MGNTNKKDQSSATGTAAGANPVKNASPASTIDNKGIGQRDYQSQSSLRDEQPPAHQLNSKEIRKKNQERLIKDAKDDFYQGNQMFREARFEDAKKNYHNALEKLKHWNEILHASSASGDRSRAASLIPTPAGPTPAASTDSREQSDTANNAGNNANNVSNPSISRRGSEENIGRQEAAVMTNLAVLQFAEGCYHESQDLLRRALEKHQELTARQQQQQSQNSQSGDLLPEIRESLTTLCIQIKKDLTLLPKNSPATAAASRDRTLISQLNEYSTLDAMIADLLNNLAACHEVIGELVDAEKFFEESLQLRIIVYGKESLKVAETMQNLATILDAQQKYRDAEKYLREALQIERKELGEDHIETAVTMNNLGVLLAHLENYAESKELLEKSVSLRDGFYGPNHHLTICARQNLDFVLTKVTENNQEKMPDEEEKKEDEVKTTAKVETSEMKEAQPEVKEKEQQSAEIEVKEMPTTTTAVAGEGNPSDKENQHKAAEPTNVLSSQSGKVGSTPEKSAELGVARPEEARVVNSMEN